jgi:hypothetical protein
MAAGFANTALMASCGAAMPTPPMEREIGPMPIRLSPFVAKAPELKAIMTNKMIVEIIELLFITSSSSF